MTGEYFGDTSWMDHLFFYDTGSCMLLCAVGGA